MRRPGQFVESVRLPGQFAPEPVPEPEPDDALYPVVPISGAELKEKATDLPALGTFGPYDILGRIALGGMAEILLARRQGDSEPVVVKKILAQYARDEEFTEMFLDEARICSALDHPNICRFLDCGEIDGQLFIAMEWVHGVTLGRLIRRARKHGGLSMPMVGAIVSRMADALHYAHTARDNEGTVMGLVHRDVSPQNIMVSYAGQVKLLDFGIAKAEVQSHRTQAGVVKGKFAYMAPEQCRGKDVDFRIDIFALGVVFYECLTSKSLYRRPSEMETMRAIVTGPVPSLYDKLESAPRELEAIVKSALAKKPEERFPTAAAMRDVLRMYVKRSGEKTDEEALAAVVQHLYAAELQQGPSVDSTPFGSSFNVTSDVRPTVAPASREGSKSARVDLGSGAPELEAIGTGQEEPLAPPHASEPPEPEPTAAASNPLAAQLDLAAELEALAEPAGGDIPVEIGTDPDEEPTALGAPRRDEPTAPQRTGATAAPAPEPAPAPQPAPAPAPAPAAPAAPAPAPEAPAARAKRAPGSMSRVVILLAALFAILAGVALGMVALESSPSDEEAAPAAQASIVVRTTPPGATVQVGERPPQPSPAVFNRLRPGQHEVVVELEGHPRWTGQVVLEAGQSGVLDVEL